MDLVIRLTARYTRINYPSTGIQAGHWSLVPGPVNGHGGWIMFMTVRSPLSAQDMQQATVNLLADMGVQPVTLQPELDPATASTDFVAPTAIITSPVEGANIGQGGNITISGTVSDIGGVVAGVEVSVDGGLTWQVATVTGGSNWTYTWRQNKIGPFEIKVRGFDDSGNMQAELQRLHPVLSM